MTYFKWCDKCKNTTSHEKVFAYLKEKYVFVCLKCYPEAKDSEKVEKELLFRPKLTR